MKDTYKIENAPHKKDCEHLLGTFLDERHYSILVDEDVDFYAPLSPLNPTNSEKNILFKFRKNVFPKQFQDAAYEGLIGAAGASQNRGLAAGPRNNKLQNRDWVTEFQIAVLEAFQDTEQKLDGSDPIDDVIKKNKQGFYDKEESRGLVWLRNKITESGESYEGFFPNWLEKTLKLNREKRAIEARKLEDNFISDTSYANPVNSGIAGFYDRYPRIDWGRACSYNEQNPELFQKSFPYLEALSSCFKKLLPERYAKQRAAADKLDPRFLVGDTVFTTITVNKTFRTAAHRDAGDLSEGFSNLGVILPPHGKSFKGGYLVLPEYDVAINIRPGDLLLIANHDAIHGNTEILPENEGDIIERMSVVAYFREKMLNLGSWEYEQARRKFIDERRKNTKHPLWRLGWNGISSKWDESQEFHDWLLKQENGQDMLDKYHPKKEPEGDLSSFFS